MFDYDYDGDVDGFDILNDDEDSDEILRILYPASDNNDDFEDDDEY